MNKISVIVPVLNEEEAIRTTIEKIRAIFNLHDDELLHEILLVDDGSSDATLNIIREEAAYDRHIKLLSFSRNFGHQIAVSAGLDHASGDAVVIIDGDMQDPPDVIPQFIEKWREGFDIVYGIRKTRDDGLIKKAFAALYYRILRSMSEVTIPLDAGDFALLDRKVVDVFRRMPERSRYLRGLRAWVGFKTIGVPFERQARYAGTSKYSLKKMIDLAASGIIGFSTIPLRFAVYVGMSMAFVSVIGGIVVFIEWIVGSDFLVRGWTSIMLAFLFVSGVQLFILGIMGEYIGRIYKEVQARPLYIIREKVGFDA